MIVHLVTIILSKRSNWKLVDKIQNVIELKLIDSKFDEFFVKFQVGS